MIELIGHIYLAAISVTVLAFALGGLVAALERLIFELRWREQR